MMPSSGISRGGRSSGAIGTGASTTSGVIDIGIGLDLDRDLDRDLDLDRDRDLGLEPEVLLRRDRRPSDLRELLRVPFLALPFFEGIWFLER